MILQDKTIVVTGVLTNASIATSIAEVATEQGASVILTSFGKATRLTERLAKRLDPSPPVLDFDATDPDGEGKFTEALAQHTDRVDGVVHAIGFAPASCLGAPLLDAPWSDVATAIEVSAYSLKRLVAGCLPLMTEGGSVVALDFDARFAWKHYNWMGVAKASLESLTRYLAREVGPSGVRVNCVTAGPIRTMAATHIPGFEDIEGAWNDRSPIDWQISNPEPVARTVVGLLSDFFPVTTGALIPADGGVHMVGI